MLKILTKKSSESQTVRVINLRELLEKLLEKVLAQLETIKMLNSIQKLLRVIIFIYKV